MKTQEVLKIALIVSAAFLLSACGARKSGDLAGTEDLSSRSTGDSSSLSSSSFKQVANCNGEAISFMTSQVMVYKDAYGTLRPDFIKMKLSNVSSQFSNADYHVKFFRWKANKSNEVYFDSTALQFRLENKSNGRAVTGYMNSLNISVLGQSGVTYTNLSSLFDENIILIDLKDELADYDALKVAIYKNGNKEAEMDMLIPSFYAHPTSYAQTHGSVLAGIHPFAGQGTSGWDINHFVSSLQEKCF